MENRYPLLPVGAGMASAAGSSLPSCTLLLRCGFELSPGVGPMRLCAVNGGRRRRPMAGSPIRAKQGESPLQYRKLGVSDLRISEVMLGTVLNPGLFSVNFFSVIFF